MQGKWSEVRNFPSQERKQKQKSLLTSKIRKQKKNDKKISDPGRDRAGKLPVIVEDEATAHLFIFSLQNEYNKLYFFQKNWRL